MAVSGRNKSSKNISGSSVAALVILLLIIASVAVYYLRSPQKREDLPTRKNLPTHVTPDTSVQQDKIPKLTTSPQSQQKEEKNSPITPIFTKPDSTSTEPALLAIIIDDVGSSLSEVRALAKIRVPLTFAIIPGLRFDKDVAAFATDNNIEIMIHIPMQSKGWPERRLEANGLLVGMNDEELEKQVDGFLKRFPIAAGVNNHMGSEFTEHPDKMEIVINLLKKNNLFFVDSVTSSKSSGLRIARQLGIKSARRDVFLDNEQERKYISGQLNQAVILAKKRGSAIAICHPHKVTIATLAEILPGLADKGVKLVSVSKLVK